MSKVWRKLNRVGKKASKYKFTTHSHILKILCNSKWQPNKICITWMRRGRKISSKVKLLLSAVYKCYFFKSNFFFLISFLNGNRAWKIHTKVLCIGKSQRIILNLISVYTEALMMIHLRTKTGRFWLKV